jgi:xylulokinase
LISLGNGGSVLEWAMRLLGYTQADLPHVDALLDGSSPLSKGLICWPFLMHGCADHEFVAGGRLGGLTLAQEPGDLLRAVLEGLACELARQLQLIHSAGFSMNRISMCGPGALSRHTPQIIANVVQCPVCCMKIPDVSAWGAAMVARALVEPHLPLATIAHEWMPEYTTIVPDRHARAYRELFQRYLEPFASNSVPRAAVREGICP